MKVGCNYWASHAGVNMWSNWSEERVREDFRLLAGAGVECVRLFPLWPDFQPLELYRGCKGHPVELRFKDAPLRSRDGVDEVMVERFKTLAAIAHEYQIELVVALVTGWMSGRLFMPPAFAGLNPLTDPLAIQWQVRMVRHLVREWKGLPAVAVWELGNECNCMAETATRAEGWNWTNAIAAAIRAEDATRPVASGMHGLMPGADAGFNSELLWTIETQAELCDLLTSHPYPHSPSKLPARVDPHDSIRSALQATVENLYYGDIGQRPAFVEEIGTFSPAYCNEETKAAFLRNALYNAWAHGSGRFLWWCGFEQSMLDFPPYDWSAWERELGLYDARYQLRPVGEELQKFRRFLAALPVKELPPFQRDAVCILTREQSFAASLGNTWSSFILAKQAGFDLEFQFIDEAPRERELLLLPGIRGACWSYDREFRAILERVKEGATLWLSIDDGAPTPFESVFGASVRSREARREPARFRCNGETFEVASPFRLTLQPESAEVLAAEEDGNPVLLRHRYGKGEVYLLTVPLEAYLAGRPGAFHAPGEPGWNRLYAVAGAQVIAKRPVVSLDPQITLTLHPDGPDRAWIVAVNHHGERVQARFQTAPGWEVPQPELPPHAGTLLSAVCRSDIG